MNVLKNFLIDFLGNIVRCGGTVASEEHTQARKDICKGCDKYGMVRPLPLLITKGCTLCGCPIQTKTKTLYHCNFKEGKPLETIKTICPHPNGSKWAYVDSKFLKL